eukprot:4381327-Ditylum_brightwellii.AAC.1
MESVQIRHYDGRLLSKWKELASLDENKGATSMRRVETSCCRGSLTLPDVLLGLCQALSRDPHHKDPKSYALQESFLYPVQEDCYLL